MWYNAPSVGAEAEQTVNSAGHFELVFAVLPVAVGGRNGVLLLTRGHCPNHCLDAAVLAQNHGGHGPPGGKRPRRRRALARLVRFGMRGERRGAVRRGEHTVAA